MRKSGWNIAAILALASCTASDPVVGSWRHTFGDGTNEELNIGDDLRGDAYLYWYDFSWAEWEVEVTAGETYEVTLRCSRDPDCRDADPIVMSCEPRDERMSCVGIAGGYDNNYAMVSLDWIRSEGSR